MVKTTLYYGPKRSIGCPFFPIFHENINTFMPIFCQKTSILSKTHCSHAHSLSKKHPFSQKHCALMLFFLSKTRQFCQNHAKKVNRMPFFSKLQESITALMPIFCQKTYTCSIKKQTALIPIRCQKNVHSLKNTVF